MSNSGDGDDDGDPAVRPEVPSDARRPSLEQLIESVRALLTDALAFEQSFREELTLVHSEHRAGARNLMHYLSVRQHDIRQLQRDLAALGLSSLGRMERCVLPTLSRVDSVLRRLQGDAAEAKTPTEPIDQESSEQLLDRHTEALLGPSAEGRSTRIMVTLSTEDDGDSIEALLRDGMNVARINCSKGEPELWRSLVGRIRQASERLDVHCPILFDLTGPNPRSVNVARKSSKPPSVKSGDELILAGDNASAEQAQRAAPKARVIGCSMPEVLPHLRAGERVIYDDGKVRCLVRSTAADTALLEVVHTAKPHQKLKPQKGLNFPDSDLPFPSLTDKDRADLDFIAAHGDIVGLSFVRSATDVEAVQSELEQRGAARVGVLLKIETTRGFNELGHLLLSAMRSERVGVMVARGDMAVELGFVRLAEAQEEVLWLGEAALVPVVWATQVLETLCKTGFPSRAEVTDAAMSGRAECVMLNRGEYVEEAVCFLHEVLTRMQAHQEKKRSMLRRLEISELSPMNR